MSAVPPDYAQRTLAALVAREPHLQTWRDSLDVEEIQQALARGGRNAVQDFVISVALLRIAGSPSSIVKRGEPVLVRSSPWLSAFNELIETKHSRTRTTWWQPSKLGYVAVPAEHETED